MLLSGPWWCPLAGARGHRSRQAWSPGAMGDRGQRALRCGQDVARADPSTGRVFSWAWARPELRPQHSHAPAPSSPRGCLLSWAWGLRWCLGVAGLWPALVKVPCPARLALWSCGMGLDWPQREGTALPWQPCCPRPPRGALYPESELGRFRLLGCALSELHATGSCPKGPQLPWIPGGALSVGAHPVWVGWGHPGSKLAPSPGGEQGAPLGPWHVW